MINNNNEFMAKKLQSGITLRAMSDRSYHPTYQYGTSVWILKIHNNDHKITGDNDVPGDAKYQCSFCSELCGLIGDIRYINNICSTCNVIEGSAELRCDRLGVYKVATRYAYAPSTKLAHYYLSSTIHQFIKASPLS